MCTQVRVLSVNNVFAVSEWLGNKFILIITGTKK